MKVINDINQFADLYSLGLQNRTTLTNEFGRLTDKSAAVLNVQIIQVSETSGESQVTVNRVTFVDSPGTEILAQDPETVRMKQGATPNQGMFALQDVAMDLDSVKV